MEPLYQYYETVRQEALYIQRWATWMLWTAFIVWVLIPTPFFRGISIGLFISSIAQLTLVVWRCNQIKRNIARTRYFMLNSMTHLHQLEIPETEKKIHDYQAIRWVDCMFCCLGFLLIILYPMYSFMQAIGMIILLQATLMLVIDIRADQRGKRYIDYLKNLSLKRFQPRDDPYYDKWPNPPA